MKEFGYLNPGYYKPGKLKLYHTNMLLFFLQLLNISLV